MSVIFSIVRGVRSFIACLGVALWTTVLVEGGGKRNWVK